MAAGITRFDMGEGLSDFKEIYATERTSCSRASAIGRPWAAWSGGRPVGPLAAGAAARRLRGAATA